MMLEHFKIHVNRLKGDDESVEQHLIDPGGECCHILGWCIIFRYFHVFHYFSFLSLRVLERIGARALVAHVRTFADFLVYEFSTSAGGQQLNKCIEILNDMVWKYNIVTLDRLILCLVSLKNIRLLSATQQVFSSPVGKCFYILLLFFSISRQCVAMKETRLRSAISLSSSFCWSQTTSGTESMILWRRTHLSTGCRATGTTNTWTTTRWTFKNESWYSKVTLDLK